MRTKPDIPCKQCKKSFHAKGTKQVFCSKPCWYVYKTKNCIPSHIGVKWNKESRRRGSLAQKKRFEREDIWNKGKQSWVKGSKHPLWGKSRPDMVGERNPNWKGGVAKENKKIRSSQEYYHWRKSVFERDNYTCQICGIRGVYLHADHVLGWAAHIESRFDINNGRTLCQKCHFRVTFGDKSNMPLTWGVNKKSFVGAS